MADDRQNKLAVIAIVVGVVGVAVTAVIGSLQLATQGMPDSAANGLPTGYPGSWNGKIDLPHGGLPGIGRSAGIEITLAPGRGPGHDVGSITVTGPWVASSAITPGCVAALHWQSGNGPISLTYDSANSTDLCKVVAFFANATINLINSDELAYEIDLGGEAQSADLYR